ncbi:MAG: LacI family DNA-binding transcriptional regulator [Acidimicrobiales bacterium]|nr:LacI family DNA-binding transcriptional regulator [Acidimicrobiales bacterium]
MATVADVAAYAGVGVGTVSRVLNGSDQVTPETRRRVLDAMETLGYRPKRSQKREAAARQGGLVAVVIPIFEEPSTHQRLRGMVEVLKAHDLRPVLYTVTGPAEARQVLMELPEARNIDGAIVMSLPLQGTEGERLATAAFPVVLLDTNHRELPRVTVDDVAGGMLATRHLIQLGHRRIAFVGEPAHNPMHYVASVHREDGYRRALIEAGIDVNDKYLRYGPHLQSVARQLAADLLSMSEPPTAIVTVSDVQALGVLEAARANRLHLPGDLSLIGYDDIDIAAFVGLSTIRQPLELSGQRAAELLIGAINSEDRPAAFSDVLPLELIVRSTTGAAPR